MDQSRNWILEKMKSRMTSIKDFNFDTLTAPPLNMMLTQDDINNLYRIATSIRYSGNPRLKYQAIDNVMKPRGFIKISAGTNRVAYRHLEYTSIVVKVATDDIGIHDNPREFQNQYLLKPFVTKVFEIDPTGVVGVFERVIPVTSREEYMSIAEDVFELISHWVIGKYVVADIGTKFFMNIGNRTGFGPVLLDFPYVYELDGNKLYCSAPDSKEPTKPCGGVIDYDDGFNFLYCTKCGAQYRVADIAKKIQTKDMIVRGTGRESKMKISFIRNGVKYTTGDDGIKPAETKIPVKTVAPEVKPEVNTIKFRQLGNHKEEEKTETVETPAVSVPKVEPVKTYTNHPLTSNNQPPVKVGNNHNRLPKYSPAEIADMKFRFSSYDAEHRVLNLGSKETHISIMMNSFDQNTLDAIFDNIGYGEELEDAKADLTAKEEALEAEKESNVSLSEALEAANAKIEELTAALNSNVDVSEYENSIKELNETIDKLDEDNAKDKDKVKELLAENSKLNDQIEVYKDTIDKMHVDDSEDEETAPAEVDESASDDEDEDVKDFDPNKYREAEYNGFVFINGNLSTTSAISSMLNGAVSPDLADYSSDTVIVFPDGNNGYMGDIDKNIVCVTSINGKSLNDLVIVEADKYQRLLDITKRSKDGDDENAVSDK